MAEGHGLHVEFYTQAVERTFKSEQAGRPIHEDAEFVKIMTPGSRDFIEREANATDRTRFPLEYARFKNGLKEEQQAIGTPLSAWPAMSRAMAKDFGAMNIYTVEQLASLSDTAMQTFGLGAREWSVKAKAFLEVAGNSAAVQKYAAENEELKNRIALLEQQMSDLAPAQEEKRGPGRPPKRAPNAVNELTEAL